MPTTYAHDAFGKSVYHRLPDAMKRLIKKHNSLYRIGLHGPDIFFYYGPGKNYINQTGIRLHGEIAYDFFAKGIRKAADEGDERLLVYLMGFACHFMLDSTCHPYIYSIAPKVSHTEVEKEMDRRRMLRDRRDPLTYFPAKGILPTYDNSMVIHKVLPLIPSAKIQKSLFGMRRSTALMIYGDGKRQKLLLFLLKLTGHYHSYGQHFMKRTANPVMEPHLDILDELYERALEETPPLLECMVKQYEMGTILPERFRRNYK